MSEKFIAAGVTILLGIIGVAVIAMLVSKSADTTGVISAGSGGFACLLRTAVTGTNQCGSLNSLIPDVSSKVIFR